MNAIFKTLVMLFFIFVVLTQSTTTTFEAKYIARIINQLPNNKAVVVSIAASEDRAPKDRGEKSMEVGQQEDDSYGTTILHGANLTWPKKLTLREHPVQYICWWREKDGDSQNRIKLSYSHDIPPSYFHTDEAYVEEYVLSSSHSSSSSAIYVANCVINIKNKLPQGKSVVVSIKAGKHKGENSVAIGSNEKEVVLFEGTIKHGGTLSLSHKVELSGQHLQYDCFWHMENDDSIRGTLYLFSYNDIPNDKFYDWNTYVVDRKIPYV